MEPIQRWSAGKKNEIVLQILRREKEIIDICRTHDLKQSEVQRWIDEFSKGDKENLKVNSKSVRAMHRKEVNQLQAKIGELVMELEARKKWEAILREEEENES